MHKIQTILTLLGRYSDSKWTPTYKIACFKLWMLQRWFCWNRRQNWRFEIYYNATEMGTRTEDITNHNLICSLCTMQTLTVYRWLPYFFDIIWKGDLITLLEVPMKHPSAEPLIRLMSLFGSPPLSRLVHLAQTLAPPFQ